MSPRALLHRLAAEKRFTMPAILTLTVGIGSTVAIFSLVYGVLLAPLPYPDPERLFDVSHAAPGLELDDMDISVPLYLRYRERVRSFEELALVRDEPVSLTGLDTPDRVRQGRVTASLFRVTGTAPRLGRTFHEDDEKPGAFPVVLVSERLWRGRLGSDPSVLERDLEIDGTRRRIVGVLPASFALPFEDVEVWVPFQLDPAAQPLGQFSHRCVARLREDVAAETALGELRAITASLTSEFPEEPAAAVLERSQFAPFMTPLLEIIVGEVRRALLVLSGAVGFVLLMASANVANLFLVRAEGRRREIALRSALGATRGRILAEFVVEGLALALVAGLLGVVVAHFAILGLLRFTPEGIPRMAQVSVDGRALLFALVVCVVAAVLSAILPLLSYSRPDALGALKEGGNRTSAGRGRVRTRRILVALQGALALVLLVGSGLMLRSFRELASVSPGFPVEGALTMRVSLPSATYGESDRTVSFVEAVSERMKAIPGVRAVGAVDTLPLSGTATGSGYSIEEFPLGETDLPPVFLSSFPDPGYQQALGFPLLEGRFLEPSDQKQGRRVVVVNETLVHRYWKDGSALGKRVAPGRPEESGWFEIVGVVADIRHENLTVPPRGTVFAPIRGPENVNVLGGNVAFVLRSGSNPEAHADAARAAVWAVDPNVPITHVLTLEELVSQARAPMAFSMSLLLLASVLAVLLAAVGTYGVVSFVVSQRTSEIGIRMALGAFRGQVRSMVLRDGLRTVLPGLVLGLVGAFFMTRAMTSMLFAVSHLDPWSFVLAPLLLLAVTIGASLLPAERAARVDPLAALRRE